MISNGDIAVLVGVVFAYFAVMIYLRVCSRRELCYRACVNCYEAFCCSCPEAFVPEPESEPAPTVLVHLLETRSPEVNRSAEGTITVELPLTLADPRPGSSSERTITYELPPTTEPHRGPSSRDWTITYELPPMSDGNGPVRSSNVRVLPEGEETRGRAGQPAVNSADPLNNPTVDVDYRNMCIRPN